MKLNRIVSIVSVLFFTACADPVAENKVNIPAVVADSVEAALSETQPEVFHEAGPTYYEKNYRKIGEHELIGSKALKKYLTDKGIPSKFKEIFITDGDSLNGEDASLALIDSVFSNDFERHPFYFVLFTRSMWWADGAFAEPLYIAAKRYAETETATLLSYLTSEKVLTDADYANWAEGIAMEISINAEGAEAVELQNLRETMLQNTSHQEHTEVEKLITKIGEFLP